MLNEAYKLLASVTVVRELYDTQKGIYDVLSEFINDTIYRENMYVFSAYELTDALNRYYSFRLNESVIKTCLKRMKFERGKGGTYICENADGKISNIDTAFSESQNRNEKLFSMLIEFLGKRLSRKLSDKEIEKSKNSFCDFLLQGNLSENEQLNQYFHEFILSIENNPELMETLNSVKEGTLLYEGIRYSNNLGEIGHWKTKLNLILDTEILFAVGGYNSKMQQDFYAELDKYIKEINRGCAIRNKKINLFYFAETKKEIDAYFNSAESIIRKQSFLDPTKEAMAQIVNGCLTPSDVQNKRTMFYQALKSADIFPYEKEFYSNEPDNKEYNLESMEIWNKYAKQWNEDKEDIHKSMVSLSHINVLRKGKNNNGFENCEFIFLTATGRTLKMANCPEFLKNGDVPLATTFEFLINRFWFKLNKGFGSNKTPRTLDMVMRSRNILAMIINSKVSQKYDEFKGKYEANEISKDDFFALNDNLRSHLKQPEEVDVDTISAEIDSLDKWNFDVAIEEQRRKEIELQNANAEIRNLKEAIETYENTQSALNGRLERVQNELKIEREMFQEEKEKIQQELDLEKQANRKRENDIIEIRKELETERDYREKREKKKALLKYYMICTLIGFLMIIGIGGFVFGMVTNQLWAKVISALLEVFGVLSLIFGIMKKFKPERAK